MSRDTRLFRMIRASHLGRIAPGLTSLLKYQRLDLPCDLRAGLSAAAVALPVGVAYAQLAGFNSAVELYSSMLPLLAYAIFGTSRQLIIGPDAATCTLVAAVVAPLASGDPKLYESLSVTLAVVAIQAILVAVVLAILRFIRLVSHPKIEILGEVQGLAGFHSIERHLRAATIPGLTLLRFNAPLVFFNGPYFKRGVTAAAGRQTEWRHWAESPRHAPGDRKISFYPTFREVITAYPSMQAHRSESL